MPLQKQNIQIPFRGLNTKIDPKQEPVGEFTQLKNVTFRKQGELSKRYGYEALSTLGVDNLDVSSPLGLADFKNQPIMLAKGQAYSYSASAGAWTGEGAYQTLVPESTMVYSPQLDIDQFNAAYAGGFGVYIWREPANTPATLYEVKITVEDLLVMLELSMQLLFLFLQVLLKIIIIYEFLALKVMFIFSILGLVLCIVDNLM